MALNTEAVQSYTPPSAALGRTVPSELQEVQWEHTEPSCEMAQRAPLCIQPDLRASAEGNPTEMGLCCFPKSPWGLEEDHMP